MPPRDQAGIVAGLAGAADIGPYRIDAARGLLADRAEQGRAAVSLATHPARLVVDKAGRDARERVIILEREAGPVARKRTAGAATLAIEGDGARSRKLDQAA